MASSQTPTLDQFLAEISQILRQRDAPKLRDYLVIEPPYSNLYHSMISELRRAFAKGNEAALETKCNSSVPEARLGEDNATWTAFTKFMVQYLGFLRDVDVQNLLETYNLLSELVQKCNSALGHPSLGILVLPTVVTYSRMLARLAIGLDKQPELIAHLTKQSTDEGGARETLPERAANIIRQAFVTCLNDRSGFASGAKGGRPEGRKVAIYTVANLCLKVLFQCKKTRNAEQMFVNIDNQSPPLSSFPRSERVTYLYYLGRFLFSSNHFRRAQLVLQAAYAQCHVKCTKQRRLILIYLIASNLILGRFPSNALLERPEAAGLAEKFEPICMAIKKGDMASFRALFAAHGPHAEWFTYFRIRLQMRNRCEVLVWRSLFRKTFLLNGSVPPPDSRNAPTFALEDVLCLARFLEKRATRTGNSLGKPGAWHTNWIFMEQHEGSDVNYADPDLEGVQVDTQDAALPDMLEIESVASSLVVQRLLNGFVSHKQLRFAITGAKRKPALEAGFPNVWQTIGSSGDEKVPGWAKESKGIAPGGFGPGMVVQLKGARPAGVGP